MKRVSAEVRRQALAMYAAMVPTATIAKVLSLYPSTVSHWARAAGVTRPRSESCRKYTLDTKFFASIDSEAKAYWLGFLYADGCVYRQTVRVLLSSTDEGHLQRLLNCVGSDQPIRSVRCGKHPGALLVVRSCDWVMDLSRHGVCPRKTYTGQHPTNVPAALVRHFVRGVFDGDGCVSYSRNQAAVDWTGGEAFLRWLAVQITTEVGLSGHSPRKTASKHAWRLQYAGNRQAAALRDWMYRDATVWLPRKRERFDQPPTSSKTPY